LNCNFAREIWASVSLWSDERIRNPAINVSIEQWWNSSLRGLTRGDQRQVAAVLISTAWHLWNERNWRIFDGVSASPARVFQLIREDLRLRVAACGSLELFSFQNVMCVFQRCFSVIL
jgi:hypothetical protein